MKKWNGRKKMLFFLFLSAAALFSITILGYLLKEKAGITDFSQKNLPPDFSHPFGTDWMGRDMFIRTLSGLSISIQIGTFTAIVSAGIAFLLGMTAASMGKTADTIVLHIIDLVMGIPHILLLILISFAAGKGVLGVIIGISFTHWTSLARVIRAEVLQLKEKPYFLAAQKLGMGKLKASWKHMTPHLLPQLFTGMILLFPHAILHEASITFLGFGLPSEEPAIGAILSESMGYLVMGKWWLALFPGLMLTIIVLLFHFIGERIEKMLNPNHIHQ